MGTSRILVTDAPTGSARLVTPDGMVAHCPLWSPDSESIAFAQDLGSVCRSCPSCEPTGVTFRRQWGHRWRRCGRRQLVVE